jgi:hypothetical protein
MEVVMNIKSKTNVKGNRPSGWREQPSNLRGRENQVEWSLKLVEEGLELWLFPDSETKS